MAALADSTFIFQEYCMSMQAHLVIIETLEENNFLETKLKENKNVGKYLK